LQYTMKSIGNLNDQYLAIKDKEIIECKANVLMKKILSCSLEFETLSKNL
jgi:hypothetical protein